MKYVSAPLLTLMQSNQTFLLADLYTITTPSGVILRYADFDTDLVSGGNTFSCSGPVFKRGRTRIVIGLEVDTLDVEIYPRPTDMVSGQQFLVAAAAGFFDGSNLKLERAFLESGNTVIWTLIMFSGVFADLEVARARISLRVNSDVSMLQVNLPRNCYQAACLQSLYSTDCGVVRASFATAGTVAAGSTVSKINCGLAQAATYFDSGYVVFTSGNMNGVKRTVKSYSPGTFSIYNPLPEIPALGVTFSIYPGCDKTMTTCQTKFSNLSKFRGFPFVPVPETAI